MVPYFLIVSDLLLPFPQTSFLYLLLRWISQRAKLTHCFLNIKVKVMVALLKPIVKVKGSLKNIKVMFIKVFMCMDLTFFSLGWFFNVYSLLLGCGWVASSLCCILLQLSSLGFELRKILRVQVPSKPIVRGFRFTQNLFDPYPKTFSI